MRYEIKGVFGKQHKRKILTGLLRAKDLADMQTRGFIVVDTYAASNPEGYQRTETPSRSRKIAKFASDQEHGIIPTSLIIYSRSQNGGIVKEEDKDDKGKERMFIDEAKLEKEAATYAKNLGYAPVSNKTVLYTADGQHRLSGFAQAYKNGDIDTKSDVYEIPITIVFWDLMEGAEEAKMEEATQFYTINMEGKRMKTDLAHNLLYNKYQRKTGPFGATQQVPTGKKHKEYVPYTTYLAKFMSEDPTSPLHGKVVPVNALKKETGAMVSESSLANSLHPFIKYAADRGMTLGDVSQLLCNYWSAIAELCPEAFNGNPSEYVLLKTPGIFSLHIALPVLLLRNSNLSKVPSVEEFKTLLGQMDEAINDEFWLSKPSEGKAGVASTFGTGAKAFQLLANAIIEVAPSATA